MRFVINTFGFACLFVFLHHGLYFLLMTESKRNDQVILDGSTAVRGSLNQIR